MTPRDATGEIGHMRALAGLLTLIITSLCAATASAQTDSGAASLLVPDAVWDGVADAPQRGWVVLVKGDSIAAVGPEARVAAPAGTTKVTLAGTTLLIGGAQVVKVLVPGRRLRDAGVPRRSIAAGVILAVVGLFVIPFVGFFIGFPLGVYLEERRRLGRHASAWRSTREALRAMGLSIVIELSATVVSAGAWLAVVVS